MSKEPWHLDRKVPIALILTILLQSGAAVWFAANLGNRVVVLERDVERQRVVNNLQESEIRAIETGAARLDEQLDNIANGINRLERQLDRLTTN
jgi:cell division protein FtsB